MVKGRRRRRIDVDLARRFRKNDLPRLRRLGTVDVRRVLELQHEAAVRRHTIRLGDDLSAGGMKMSAKPVISAFGSNWDGSGIKQLLGLIREEGQIRRWIRRAASTSFRRNRNRSRSGAHRSPRARPVEVPVLEMSANAIRRLAAVRRREGQSEARIAAAVVSGFAPASRTRPPTPSPLRSAPRRDWPGRRAVVAGDRRRRPTSPSRMRVRIARVADARLKSQSVCARVRHVAGTVVLAVAEAVRCRRRHRPEAAVQAIARRRRRTVGVGVGLVRGWTPWGSVVRLRRRRRHRRRRSIETGPGPSQASQASPKPSKSLASGLAGVGHAPGSCPGRSRETRRRRRSAFTETEARDPQASPRPSPSLSGLRRVGDAADGRRDAFDSASSPSPSAMPAPTRGSQASPTPSRRRCPAGSGLLAVGTVVLAVAGANRRPRRQSPTPAQASQRIADAVVVRRRLLGSGVGDAGAVVARGSAVPVAVAVVSVGTEVVDQQGRNRRWCRRRRRRRSRR